MIRSTDHIIGYFKFPKPGARSIAQIKLFIMSLNIKLKEIINVEIISEDTIELTILKLNLTYLLDKIRDYSNMKVGFKLEEILNTENPKIIEQLLLESLLDYKECLTEVKDKLEELNIKYRKRRFLEVLIKKIEKTVNLEFDK